MNRDSFALAVIMVTNVIIAIQITFLVHLAVTQ